MEPLEPISNPKNPLPAVLPETWASPESGGGGFEKGSYCGDVI
jgi:hypothetical protein